jgi:CHASE2 domain-containing sensor protein
MFMVITEDQSTAAWQLIGSGSVSLAISAPSIVSALRNGPENLQMMRRDRARLVLRFGLSSASYLAIISAGVMLLSSLTSAFPAVIVVAVVVLLVVSLRNTWDLLVTVGEVTLGGEQGKD